MAEKVTFNGTSKLIICETGVTSLNFAEEVYSAWKRWIVLSDNLKYLEAISVIGGDPLTGVIRLGTTFFMENGWKLRPYEGNHTLVVSGNIYSRDGSSIFVPTLGSYNVLIQTTKSNLIDTVTMGSGVTAQDKTDIINGMLNEALNDHRQNGTVGKKLYDLPLSGSGTGAGPTISIGKLNIPI